MLSINCRSYSLLKRIAHRVLTPSAISLQPYAQPTLPSQAIAYLGLMRRYKMLHTTEAATMSSFYYTNAQSLDVEIHHNTVWDWTSEAYRRTTPFDPLCAPECAPPLGSAMLFSLRQNRSVASPAATVAAVLPQFVFDDNTTHTDADGGGVVGGGSGGRVQPSGWAQQLYSSSNYMPILPELYDEMRKRVQHVREHHEDVVFDADEKQFFACKDAHVQQVDDYTDRKPRFTRFKLLALDDASVASMYFVQNVLFSSGRPREITLFVPPTAQVEVHAHYVCVTEPQHATHSGATVQTVQRERIDGIPLAYRNAVGLLRRIMQLAAVTTDDDDEHAMTTA